MKVVGFSSTTERGTSTEKEKDLPELKMLMFIKKTNSRRTRKKKQQKIIFLTKVLFLTVTINISANVK